MNNAQPERHPLFFGPNGLRAGWSLLLYLLMLWLFLSASHSIIHALHHTSKHSVSSGPHEATFLSILIAESIPFLVVVLVSWIMSLIERRPVGDYGFGGVRKIPRFLSGLGWGIVFLSLLVLTLKLTGLLIFDARLLHGPSILRHAAAWSIAFLFVALLEEYLLRGYLQFTLSRALASIYDAFLPTYSRTLGFWTAALLLSFVFGLGHSSNRGESPIGLFAAGIAGLVFCLSLWRTGSLWWAVGFHTSWDWAQSFLYGVADSGTMVQFHLFATHPVGKPLLSGGATGPEGSIFILPTMTLVAITILLTLPKVQPSTSTSIQSSGSES